jgi:hypothetical protein
LRQGSLFQASLDGVICLARSSFGAFLFAILLILYLPYNRVHVSVSSDFLRGIGFLDNLSTGGIGWCLLTVSTTCESLPVVIPFRIFVCRYFRLVLYAELLSSEDESLS